MMLNIVNDPSPKMLKHLRQRFEAEWGEVDPFTSSDPKVPIPLPLVALGLENKFLGGLSFTTAARPGSSETCVWINALLVDSNQRGKGIASELVRAAEAAALESHIGELYVLTEFPDLYRKLGWQDVGHAEREVVLKKIL